MNFVLLPAAFCAMHVSCLYNLGAFGATDVNFFSVLTPDKDDDNHNNLNNNNKNNNNDNNIDVDNSTTNNSKIIIIVTVDTHSQP